MSIVINYRNTASQPSAMNTLSQGHDQSLLDAKLLHQAEQLLAQWCGEVKRIGNEICMKNPLRNDAHIGSFKFNIQTGAWSDFAMENCSGYGLSTLYATITRTPLVEAIKVLDSAAYFLPFEQKKSTDKQQCERSKVEAVNPDEVPLPPDCHADLGFPTNVWEYRDAQNRLSFYVNRFDIGGKKETRPLSWSPEKCAWLWQYPQGPFMPYNLMKLLANPGSTVVITEGEKAADAAALLFPDTVIITSACGSEQALKTDWSFLKGRKVIIAPDNDAPGKHYAQSVAGAALVQGAASVHVLDVWKLDDWDSGDDLADHTVASDFLDDAVEVFTLFEQTALEHHIVKAATHLGRGDFDRIKPALAKQLGIGARTFEGLVKDARTKDKESTETETTPNFFPNDALEPWGESVDGDELFNEIVGVVTRYVILSASQSVAVAAWILFSYCFEGMRICPKLLINSPSKRCGKSTLMEVIMSLVRRALPAANITPAAIFRAIEFWKPTLLIDEADTFLNRPGNEEITGILNSGHTRAFAYVVRTEEVEGKHVPVRFSTFAPQVIAMIKTPTDTLIDRSIVITLARKMPNQKVTALAIDAADQFKDIRRRINRWVEDHLSTVEFKLEEVPQNCNDRARQNWAVLAAITKALGPKSHNALLVAAIELADTSGIEENVETDLLADLRELLLDNNSDHIPTKVLIKQLGEIPDSRWAEVNRGKPITGHDLARRLKPFGITPLKYRDGTANQRGYSIAALRAVFDRYLPLGQEVSK